MPGDSPIKISPEIQAGNMSRLLFVPDDMSVITNNRTGEQLEIIVETMSVSFVNDFGYENTTDGVEDSSGSSGLTPASTAKPVSRDALLTYLHLMPIEISITGFLAHPPEPGKAPSERGRAGVGEITYGSFERPSELYTRGQEFSNDKTTFQFQTPAYPGIIFDDLMIRKYETIAEGPRANSYVLRLEFQTVLIDDKSFAGKKPTVKTLSRGSQAMKPAPAQSPQQPLSAPQQPAPGGGSSPFGPFPLSAEKAQETSGLLDGILQAAESIVGAPANLLEQLGGALGGLKEQVANVAKGVQSVLEAPQKALAAAQNVVNALGDLGLPVGPVNAAISAVQTAVGIPGAIAGGAMHVLGSLPFISGSLPKQTFDTVINGRRFFFEMFWYDPLDYGRVSVRTQSRQLIQDSPLIMGEDVFDAIQHLPETAGLHIVPVSYTNVAKITSSNVGKDVQMLVLANNG